MSPPGKVLAGRSILVVEDEPLIASEIHAAFSAAVTSEGSSTERRDCFCIPHQWKKEN
jgi:hypothetical protein